MCNVPVTLAADDDRERNPFSAGREIAGSFPVRIDARFDFRRRKSFIHTANLYRVGHCCVFAKNAIDEFRQLRPQLIEYLFEQNRSMSLAA